MLQLLYLFLRIGQLLFEHFPHFFILFLFQHGNAVLDGFFIFLIFTISVYDRLQITLLLHKLLEMLLVICNSGLSQFIQYLLKANEQIV